MCSSVCAATETPTVGMGRTSRTAREGFVRRESSLAEAPGGAYTPAGSATGTGIVRVGSTRKAMNAKEVRFRELQLNCEMYRFVRCCSRSTDLKYLKVLLDLMISPELDFAIGVLKRSIVLFKCILINIFECLSELLRSLLLDCIPAILFIAYKMVQGLIFKPSFNIYCILGQT